MKVLLLGSGGREAALAWKVAQSGVLTKLFCMPGNPGIEPYATLVAGDCTDATFVCRWATEHQIDLVIVGPEAPLMNGVADALRAAGVAVFGPGAGAANIEGSKAFAKEIMHAAGVPTARSEVFVDAAAAEQRAMQWGAVVVKADGLAAGKGVIVADDGVSAAAAVRELARLPGGSTLVLEERLTGPELSLIALCDGERAVLLPPAQDHKRLLDGDRGPNTGGMGTWAPASLLAATELERLKDTVFLPVLRELKTRGHEFRGALFAGLMLTPAGPMVLEFNARFGDPETQSIMMLLKGDLLPLLRACAEGALQDAPLPLHEGVVVTVVAAAEGYPDAPVRGAAISGIESLPPGVQCFQAGTVRTADGSLRTQGGRVLAMSALAADLTSARTKAYEALKMVHFEGMQFRGDIAARG